MIFTFSDAISDVCRCKTCHHNVRVLQVVARVLLCSKGGVQSVLMSCYYVWLLGWSGWLFIGQNQMSLWYSGLFSPFDISLQLHIWSFRKIIMPLSSISCMVWCINYVWSTNGVGKCMFRFMLGVWGLLWLIKLPNNKTFHYHKNSTKPLRAYIKQVYQDTGTGLLGPSDAWVKLIWRPHLHPCHSRHLISVMENIELQSHYSLNTSPVNHRTPPTDAWRRSRLWMLVTPLSVRRIHKLLSPEP